MQAKEDYQQSFQKYGGTPAGVRWSNETSQERRFEQLIRLIPSSVDQFTVNDFGCGYGELFNYLKASRSFHQGTYVGYDFNNDIIAYAQKHTTDPRANFICANQVLYPADYTLLSGTLNLKMAASNRQWWTYIQQVLLQIWGQSRRGLGFNLLVPRANPPPHPTLFYAKPAQVMHFCQQNMQAHIEWSHDQSLGDICFLLTRKGQTDTEL